MTRRFRITLASPDVGDDEKAAVAAVLDSPVLSRGPRLAEFEAGFCDWTGAAHAVGLSSGTAAVHLALAVAGAGPGRRVITSAYTVPATVNPALALGAEVVFVDIDPATRALAVAAVASILRGDDIVLAVHPFGQAAPVAELEALCASRGATLLEDACEALGTRIESRHAGRFGLAASFGFYPNKQLTTGEGGMLITDSEEVANQVRLLANHGRAMDGRWLDQVTRGYNYRLSELGAALGLVQLQRLPALLRRRRELVDLYRSLLDSTPLVLPPNPENAADSVGWFALVGQLDESLDRDDLIDWLARDGIQAGRYFAPLHLQPGLSDLGCPRGGLPVTERVAASSVALPLHTRLTDDDVREVAASVQGWLTTR